MVDKGQVEGSGVSGDEDKDMVIPKLQVIQKISLLRDLTRPQIAFIAV